MRTPIYVLIAALVVGGCTHHHHAAPASSTSRPVDRIDEPDPVEPLDLDVGRPSGGQLPLQTNRPAYVAIFEILPNRGVTLIYPAAVHQQDMMVSGLTWVPLWWSPKRVTFNSDRYIYAVASEEPLQLSDETFVGGYFNRVLGPGIYRAERPYSTMRAIARAVVPNVAEEQWAEDVYVLSPTYLTETYRTARIHCPGGRVFNVPEDMVARIWCPTRTRVVIIDASSPRTRDYPVSRPVRPDSVIGQGGGRVRFEPRRRGPIVRIVDPSGRDCDDRDDRDMRRGRDDRDDRDDRRRGRDAREDDRDNRDTRDEDSEKTEKEKEKRGLIRDLIKDAKQEEKEREKQEKERQRREAEEARRREAEERKAEREERQDERREEREARKDAQDERKDERKDDQKDERKNWKDERKDERKDEPKQQGQPREESRDEKREESRDDTKRRGSIKDLMKKEKKP